MSDTQYYKTLTISAVDATQLFLALYAREEELKTLISDFESIDWKRSVEKCRADLEIVTGLINRITK